MTIGIAWVGRRKDGRDHLYIAADSRTRGAYCYKAYCRSGQGFSSKPAAYLNLLSPTDRFPLDPSNVAGALEVFRLLLPSNSFD
jgi:hypothetical protein